MPEIGIRLQPDIFAFSINEFRLALACTPLTEALNNILAPDHKRTDGILRAFIVDLQSIILQGMNQLPSNYWVTQIEGS